jgi:hypothetical protein
MIPPGHAVRSLLALKLFGNARHSHIMSHVFDKGLGIFVGLNEIPKRSFLTEYSCRVPPECQAKLMQRWFDAVGSLGLKRGLSFDLDFHTVPYHGDDALIEKHYVSKRSRRQKGVLVFLARDADQIVFSATLTPTSEKTNKTMRFSSSSSSGRREPAVYLRNWSLIPS